MFNTHALATAFIWLAALGSGSIPSAHNENSAPILFGLDGNGFSLATTQASGKCAEMLSDQVMNHQT